MGDETIIIGGGLAGLAAATALVRHGVRATVLESRPRLGGRASSFVDQATGETIDNCQHVTMGCCTNFRHFCQTVGTDRLFRIERKLHFVGPPETLNDVIRTDRLVSCWLPAPLHLLPSFRRLSYLSNDDKRSLARGLRRLARCDPDTEATQSFQQWLTKNGQSDTVIERFWHVVIISALSETLDQVSIRHARKVFVDAFLANRHGWEVSIPTVPLDVLYGERLQKCINEQGGRIRLKTGVRRLIESDNLISGVELRSGEVVSADQFVLAVPHTAVKALLPESMQGRSEIQRIGRLGTAPIASIHLWFDRPFTKLPHAVFVGHFCQWMFNRSNSQENPKAEGSSDVAEVVSQPGHYYQIVISAAHDVTQQPRQSSIGRALAELTAVWPTVAEAKLLHSRLVIEHDAVFSARPGSDDLRPAQQSPIPNLQFAGDWTATGWPATMEGAVRSGYLAAENILRHFGKPTRLVQPDLPVGLLSRLLLNL